MRSRQVAKTWQQAAAEKVKREREGEDEWVWAEATAMGYSSAKSFSGH